MNADTNISRELKEKLQDASTGLHAVTVPIGDEKVWSEIHHREFDMTPTLAHILADSHTTHLPLEHRPKV